MLKQLINKLSMSNDKYSAWRVIQDFEDKGINPSIDRTNTTPRGWRGYSVGPSKKGNFTEVNYGYRVCYYGNPFNNVYRIVARDGQEYITHKVS